MSLFANAQREPPDLPGVAMWVAANDKPAAAAKPVTGDVTEIKLKHEIMQLSARERYRLKNLQEVCLFYRVESCYADQNRILPIVLKRPCNRTSMISKSNSQTWVVHPRLDTVEPVRNLLPLQGCADHKSQRLGT